MFYPDNPTFGRHIIAISGPYSRHAIGIENNLVVCTNIVSEQPFQSQIQCLPIHVFSSGWELRYVQYQNMNLNLLDIRNRAASSVGVIDTHSFDLKGDNFAIWCVTGAHLQALQNKNPYFGQHLYIDRAIGIYQHHGIGTENGVVHFNNLQDKHVIHIVPYQRFSHGKDINVIPYRQRLDPLQVRNRAMNSIGVSGYDLFENNCEHFATWCLTGIKRSLQSEEVQGAIKIGLIGAGLLAAIYSMGKLLEQDK